MLRLDLLEQSMVWGGSCPTTGAFGLIQLICLPPRTPHVSRLLVFDPKLQEGEIPPSRVHSSFASFPPHEPTQWEWSRESPLDPNPLHFPPTFPDFQNGSTIVIHQELVGTEQVGVSENSCGHLTRLHLLCVPSCTVPHSSVTRTKSISSNCRVMTTETCTVSF